MTGQLTGSMSRVMDGLAADARSHRDAAVNTLDAVDRQTKAASLELAKTVVTVPPPTAAELQQRGLLTRDDRFDPEDWSGAEQPATDAPHPPASATSAAPSPNGRSARRDDDDDEDYPETWLR